MIHSSLIHSSLIRRNMIHSSLIRDILFPAWLAGPEFRLLGCHDGSRGAFRPLHQRE